MEKSRDEYSLLELNNRIRKTITSSFADTYWVRAELCDVRTNMSSGHCYMECIEKHAVSGQIVAKARASIWAKTFRMLKPYFELETGQAFTSGIKVLVKVLVEFHEVYGLNLTILDIDPAYTVGDLMKRRMEVIRRLKEDGVFTLNKELEMAEPVQCIAIITSPTAAGYEDFINQLHHNTFGYVFYTKLFPAVMQGDKVEESVIRALDRIYEYADHFDAVVIIRGGGATSELNCFDSYLLSSSCAQFPLPVITGIGHERDDSIVDMVAHTRMKTPTAVAEFLVNRMHQAAGQLTLLQDTIVSLTEQKLKQERSFLQSAVMRLPMITMGRLDKNKELLRHVSNRIQLAHTRQFSTMEQGLDQYHNRLLQYVPARLEKESRFLEVTEQYVRMASPDYILKKGYSIVMKNGQIVKGVQGLERKDRLTIRLQDGEVQTEVI